jgi:hypothetical protein
MNTSFNKYLFYEKLYSDDLADLFSYMNKYKSEIREIANTDINYGPIQISGILFALINRYFNPQCNIDEPEYKEFYLYEKLKKAIDVGANINLISYNHNTIFTHFTIADVYATHPNICYHDKNSKKITKFLIKNNNNNIYSNYEYLSKLKYTIFAAIIYSKFYIIKNLLKNYFNINLLFNYHKDNYNLQKYIAGNNNNNNNNNINYLFNSRSDFSTSADYIKNVNLIRKYQIKYKYLMLLKK